MKYLAFVLVLSLASVAVQAWLIPSECSAVCANFDSTINSCSANASVFDIAEASAQGTLNDVTMELFTNVRDCVCVDNSVSGECETCLKTAANAPSNTVDYKTACNTLNAVQFVEYLSTSIAPGSFLAVLFETINATGIINDILNNASEGSNNNSGALAVSAPGWIAFISVLSLVFLF